MSVCIVCLDVPSFSLQLWVIEADEAKMKVKQKDVVAKKPQGVAPKIELL